MKHDSIELETVRKNEPIMEDIYFSKNAVFKDGTILAQDILTRLKNSSEALSMSGHASIPEDFDSKLFITFKELPNFKINAVCQMTGEYDQVTGFYVEYFIDDMLLNFEYQGSIFCAPFSEFGVIKIQRVQVLIVLSVQGDKVCLDSVRTVAMKELAVTKDQQNSLFQRAINYKVYYLLKNKKSDLSSAISFFSRNLLERLLPCYHLVD